MLANSFTTLLPVLLILTASACGQPDDGNAVAELKNGGTSTSQAAYAIPVLVEEDCTVLETTTRPNPPKTCCATATCKYTYKVACGDTVIHTWKKTNGEYCNSFESAPPCSCTQRE